MRNKGMTLVSLAITIIILGIIATVTIYFGINTITAARIKRFTAEMEIIRLKCNELLEEGITIEELVARGQEIENLPSNKLSKVNNILQKVTNSHNSEGYVYFNSLDLQDLGIISINREIIINFKDKIIIDLDGVKDSTGEYIHTVEWTSNAVLATNERVQSITLDNSSYILTIGRTFTLSPIITPNNANNKKVTWTSSNTNVATVAPNGVVTGVSIGNAIIIATAQDGGKTASCEVSVVERGATVETVTIIPTEVTVQVGKTSTLTAIITPYNATNKNVTWTSSNTSVATVAPNGVVTGVKGGTAIITVTTQDGRKTAICSVTIDPNPFDKAKVPKVVIETSTIAGVSKERIAPIPAGYTASKVSTEDQISEGLVIYQGEEDVTSENHSTAILNRNQFVWIPVDDINDMVMCKQNGNAGTNGTTCNLEYSEINNEITCKTHNYTTATALTDATIDTTGLAGRLYATTTNTTDTAVPYIYTASMEFTQTKKDEQKFSTVENFREPDIVPDYDNSNFQLILKESTTEPLTSANELKKQLNNKFIEMAKSVAQYGGFYVSRYEIGTNGASLKNQKVLVAGTTTRTNHDPNTYINGNLWYGIYNTLISSTAVDKTALNSHMIWGCQFHMIIKFLSENSMNEPQIGHEIRQKNTQELTGETTTDIMSNIYDMEGNNVEWTAQANGTNNRVRVGENFYLTLHRKIWTSI